MKKLFVLPPSLNKRLISTLMASSNSTDPAEIQSFSLKSNSEFATRLGNVFGELKTLEKNHEEWMSENPTVEPSEDKDPASTLHNDTEIFKKPLPTKQWKRKSRVVLQPDKRRRQKWTKYSLEDIPLSSDAKNASIALQCINELRMRKAKNNATVDTNNEKIVFRKPLPVRRKACAHLSPSTSANGNPSIVSPLHHEKEVVVVKNKEDAESCNVKLNHLLEEDNDNTE